MNATLYRKFTFSIVFLVFISTALGSISPAFARSYSARTNSGKPVDNGATAMVPADMSGLLR